MSTRGPKPQSAQVHYLTGGADKRDHSGQLDAHVACEVPACPSWLSKDAKKVWKYITKELERYGMISKLDRHTLATYCSAVAMFEQTERKIQELEVEGKTALTSKTPQGYEQVSALWVIRNKAFDQIKVIAEQFGLTPSARARVKVKDPNQGELDLV